MTPEALTPDRSTSEDQLVRAHLHRGASFERHAATRIRGALLDELRDSDWASRSVRSRAGGSSRPVRT